MSIHVLTDAELFSAILYKKLIGMNPGIEELELYEFKYALANLLPIAGGWVSISPYSCQKVEAQVSSRDFYTSIQVKPRIDGKIALDPAIVRLTNMLFVGLVTDTYPVDWVNAHFYFDIRGFFFLPRTIYFTEPVLAHLGGKPYKQFEQKQKLFERDQGVGYRQFRIANEEVDRLFIDIVQQLAAAKGTPLLLAIAGPTAAGKTEIVERLHDVFARQGRQVSSVELDNFFTDRDQREEKGIDSLGGEAMHLALLTQSLKDLCRGQKVAIPRYDFINGTSSHDLDGRLKPGCIPVEIEPAHIIIVEGNFPFLLQDVIPLIGIKVVYLTDDPVRLKRKWKRDMDYRKKYDVSYFRNRFFKDQFLMAQACYRPQMQTCDMVVDTTGAAVWTTPEVAGLLSA